MMANYDKDSCTTEEGFLEIESLRLSGNESLEESRSAAKQGGLRSAVAHGMAHLPESLSQ
jgi:hypothetical protein